MTNAYDPNESKDYMLARAMQPPFDPFSAKGIVSFNRLIEMERNYEMRTITGTPYAYVTQGNKD
jgi:hypothetical protein